MGLKSVAVVVAVILAGCSYIANQVLQPAPMFSEIPGDTQVLRIEQPPSLPSLASLQVSKSSGVAVKACVYAATFAECVEQMTVELSPLPDDMREMLVARAFKEGVLFTANSFRLRHTSSVNATHAWVMRASWQVEQRPNQTRACITASHYEFEAARTFVGFKKTVTHVKVDEQESCKFKSRFFKLGCSTGPVTKRNEIEEAVYRPTYLSPAQTEELLTYMDRTAAGAEMQLSLDPLSIATTDMKQIE